MHCMKRSKKAFIRRLLIDNLYYNELQRIKYILNQLQCNIAIIYSVIIVIVVNGLMVKSVEKFHVSLPSLHLAKYA